MSSTRVDIIRLIAVMVFGTLVFSCVGCVVLFHKGSAFDDIDMEDFPIERASLLSMSSHWYRYEGPTDSIARSMVAAENVLILDQDNELANFFASRAALWLIEFGGNDIDKSKLADKGFQWAEAAYKADPSRGEFAFLTGAHLGFKIQESLHPSLIRLRKVHEYFQKAVDQDPTYDQGAPLRALGSLLVQAPPWPTAFGDIDEGIEFLEKAVSMFPGHPANQLYLGIAYQEDGQFLPAKKAFETVLKLCEGDRFGVPGLFWKKSAKDGLKKVEKQLPAGKSKP